MANWVRLWDDMPTDPKWRVIARRSGQSISDCISVFVFMMTNAGANSPDRGALLNWSDEDVGAALDLEPEQVASIRSAMQGKTLDGERLSGWDRRQPKREDSSSERVKEWRKRNVTQRNAPDTDTDTDTELVVDASAQARDLDKIENACRVAAGLSSNPSPGLCDLSPILGLIDQGADLESEIIPAIRARPSQRARSWQYFVPQIQEARARRKAAAEAPLPPVDAPKARAGPRPPPTSFLQSGKSIIEEMSLKHERECDKNPESAPRLAVGYGGGGG